MNIKLVLEYDGSSFFGFQRQPTHPTVQEAVEKALSKFFNRQMKIAAASGRTDTGVHASYQVVNFHVESLLSPAAIQKGLNACLPHAIAVKEISEVPEDFHARYSARSKTYEYWVWNSAVRSPLHAAKMWHVQQPLDIKKIKQAAPFLKGKHDFRSFCAANATSKTSVRTIKRLKVEVTGQGIRFTFEADGFLYHMIRNIVGTLIEIGKGKMQVSDIPKILRARNRTLAGRTAPAQGLCLIDVKY